MKAYKGIILSESHPVPGYSVSGVLVDGRCIKTSIVVAVSLISYNEFMVETANSYYVVKVD